MTHNTLIFFKIFTGFKSTPISIFEEAIFHRVFDDEVDDMREKKQIHKTAAKLKHMEEEEFVVVMITNLTNQADRLCHVIYKSNHGILTGVDISHMILDIVAVASQFGVNINAAVCDGASSQRWWQEMFFHDEDELKSKLHVVRKKHPITGKPFFFISDPSHGIKKLINILLQSNKHDVKIDIEGVEYEVSTNLVHELFLKCQDSACSLSQFGTIRHSDMFKTTSEMMGVASVIRQLDPVIKMIEYAFAQEEVSYLRSYHSLIS